MQFKYQSLATPLLICSLLIGLSSAYLGDYWGKSAKSLKANAVLAQKEISTLKETLTNIEENLAEGAPAQDLDVLVPDVLLAVYNQRTEHGITITKAMTLKNGGAQKPSVGEMADAVPGSSLKSFALRVSGTYKSYPGLQAYLNLLTTKAVAVSKLDLTEQSFDVLLTIYGTTNEK